MSQDRKEFGENIGENKEASERLEQAHKERIRELKEKKIVSEAEARELGSEKEGPQGEIEPENGPEEGAEAELHGEFDREDARKAVEAVAESAEDGDPGAEGRGEVVAKLLSQDEINATLEAERREKAGEEGDGEGKGEEGGEALPALPEDLVKEANKGNIWGKRIIDFLAGMKRGAPTFFAGMGAGAIVRMGVRGALSSVGLLNAAGGLGVGVLAGGLAGAGRGWYREWRAYRSFVSKDLGLEKGKIVEKMPAAAIAAKMKELESAFEQAREAKQRKEAEAISDKMRYLRIAAMKGERGMKPYERAMEILDQRKEELASDQDRHAKLLWDLSRGSQSLLWTKRVAKSAIIGAAGGAVGAFLVDWIATGSFSEGLKEWMPGGGGGDGGGGGIPPEGPSGAETAPTVPGEPAETAPAVPAEPAEPAEPTEPQGPGGAGELPADGGEKEVGFVPGEESPDTGSAMEEPSDSSASAEQGPEGKEGDASPSPEAGEPVPVGPESIAEMIPQKDIPLEAGSNPWEVVKAKLSEILPDGRTPTDAEIMYVTRELAEKSNINVPSWGVAGDVLHTEIPVGYELKFSDPEVQEAFRDVLKGDMKPFVPVEAPSVPEASVEPETAPQAAAEPAPEDAAENVPGPVGNFESVDTDSILRMTRTGNLEDAAQKLSEQAGISYEDALKNVRESSADMNLSAEGIEKVREQAYDDALDMVRQGNAGEGAKILSDSWGMSENNARSVLERVWEDLPEVDKMKPGELISFLKGSFPELGGVNIENAAVRSLLEKTTVENAMAGRFSWDGIVGDSVPEETQTAIRTLLEKAKAGTYSAFFNMDKGLDKVSVWEFLRDQVGRAGKQ